MSLSLNNSNASLNKTSLTFTPSNYDTNQTVTISNVGDDNHYTNKTCIITLSSKKVSQKTINVTIINTTPSPYGNIVVISDSISMYEDSIHELSVKLDKAPGSDQVVYVSCGNNEGIISNKTSLTFTPSNYDTYQSVDIISSHQETYFDDRFGKITLSSKNVENVVIDVLIMNIDDPIRTITYELTNCTSSNTINEIYYGRPYSTTITPKENYRVSSIKVTSNGQDITSEVVDEQKISINSVVGDLVVTAIAEEDIEIIEVVCVYSGYVSTTDGDINDTIYYVATGFIDISGYIEDYELTISVDETLYRLDTYGAYQQNYAFIEAKELSSRKYSSWTLDGFFDRTHYLRISICSKTVDSEISPSEEPIVTLAFKRK